MSFTDFHGRELKAYVDKRTAAWRACDQQFYYDRAEHINKADPSELSERDRGYQREKLLEFIKWSVSSVFYN